jgi:predicted nucleic acid-binding protein
MQFFQRYRDKEFSFTDRTSFALMERMRITTAFAFDIHFRQYGRFAIVPQGRSQSLSRGS